MPVRIILNEISRKRAHTAIDAAPDGCILTISEPAKRRAQEEKYHAMIGDISRQHQFFGELRDSETVKRLLVDAFARVKAKMGEPLAGHGEMLPSLDGDGVVQLGAQTRNFTIALAAEFIEFLYAWGTENNIKWTEQFSIPGWAK